MREEVNEKVEREMIASYFLVDKNIAAVYNLYTAKYILFPFIISSVEINLSAFPFSTLLYRHS